ncbi:hypothetical protein MHU86_3954 [Fragilaria crotonensis]|nr:hypothetical protein MHU86_3954 [Fragilaria crotonensis]
MSRHRHCHAEDQDERDSDESAGSISSYSDDNVSDEADDDNDTEKLLQMVYTKPLIPTNNIASGRTQQPERRQRETRVQQPVMWTDDDGTLRRFYPHQSLWFNIYVAHPRLEDTVFHKQFRTRFRLPYAQFTELHQSLQPVGGPF